MAAGAGEQRGRLNHRVTVDAAANSTFAGGRGRGRQGDGDDGPSPQFRQLALRAMAPPISACFPMAATIMPPASAVTSALSTGR